MDRLLGKIEGDLPGPLIVCIAALHGNEQVGLHAFRNVYSAIKQHNIKFRGKLVGIAGNIPAIRSDKRFIDTDLNRIWDEERVGHLVEGNFNPRNNEEQQLLEIYELISQECQGAYTLKVMADLHSTSSDKGNFVVVPEDISKHAVVRALKLPKVVNIDKYLKGTLLSYYHKNGYISFAFEGGMIGTEGVYQLHTSGLWEILDKAGCITHHDHEMEDHYTRKLDEISESLPRSVKVIYREKVQPGDGFKMLPGFYNFMPVKKGQQLAINQNGPVTSPQDGLIFMPLYQPEGEDGFFIVKRS